MSTATTHDVTKDTYVYRRHAFFVEAGQYIQQGLTCHRVDKVEYYDADADPVQYCQYDDEPLDDAQDLWVRLTLHDGTTVCKPEHEDVRVMADNAPLLEATSITDLGTLTNGKVWWFRCRLIATDRIVFGAKVNPIDNFKIDAELNSMPNNENLMKVNPTTSKQVVVHAVAANKELTPKRLAMMFGWSVMDMCDLVVLLRTGRPVPGCSYDGYDLVMRSGRTLQLRSRQ